MDFFRDGVLFQEEGGIVCRMGRTNQFIEEFKVKF
jgi:hypothetical protein